MRECEKCKFYIADGYYTDEGRCLYGNTVFSDWNCPDYNKDAQKRWVKKPKSVATKSDA